MRRRDRADRGLSRVRCRPKMGRPITRDPTLSSSAEDLELPEPQRSPEIARKWRAIQIAMVEFPDQAVRELLAHFAEAMDRYKAGERGVIVDFVDDWHRRAMFVFEQRSRPVEPVVGPTDWHKLPERSFR